MLFIDIGEGLNRVGALLAAPARSRPHVAEPCSEDGARGHVPAGLAPCGEHRVGFAHPDVLGVGRPRILDSGGHVAGVGVGERVDDILARRHVACTPDCPLDQPLRHPLVVGAVVDEGRLDDRSVVGERGEDSDRDVIDPVMGAAQLIHAQHVDRRVDRVGVAAGILVHVPAVGTDVRDPVVRQAGPEAAVLRNPK